MTSRPPSAGDLSKAKSRFHQFQHTYTQSVITGGLGLAEVPSTLRLYQRLKQDIRALFSHLSNDLGINDSTEVSKQKIAEQNKFELDFPQSKFDTCASNEICTIIGDLVELKSELTYRMATALFKEVGTLDFDITTPSHSDGSKDVQSLIDLSRLFLTMDKKLKQAQLTSSSSADISVQLVAKQLLLETAEKEIESLHKDMLILKNKLTMLTNTSNRNQELISLSEKLEELESTKGTLESEILNVSNENIQLVQKIALLNEQNSSLKTQLDAAKSAYLRDISDLKPLLEQQYRNVDNSFRESNALQKDKHLMMARVKEVEKRYDAMSEALGETERANKVLMAENARMQAQIKGLESDIGRRTRINTVIVAAKVNAEDEAKYCKLKMQEAEKDRDVAVNFLKSTTEEMAELEKYILKLQRYVQDSEANEKKIFEKYQMERANSAALEILVKDLQVEVHRFSKEGGGMSSEAQERWDARETIISHMKDELENLKTECAKQSKEIMALKKKEKTLIDENRRLAAIAGIDL